MFAFFSVFVEFDLPQLDDIATVHLSNQFRVNNLRAELDKEATTMQQ